MRIKTQMIAALVVVIGGCSKDKSSAPDANQPPTVPSDPSPVNGAVSVVRDVELAWDCVDPDSDFIDYDIYFGSNPTPPLRTHLSTYQIGRITYSFYSSDSLRYDSTYFWRIEAHDEHHRVSGPTWHFTVRSQAINLTPIARFDTPGGVCGVFVSGNLAFIADGDSGLLVLDVLNAAAPSMVGHLNIPDCVYRADVEGSHAYAFCSSSGVDWLRVIDVSDPANPVLRGSYELPEYSYLNDMAVEDGRVYLAFDYTVEILDVSDPENPVATGNLGVPGHTGGACGVSAQGNYIYVACADAGLQVVDVSDVYNPQIIGDYDGLRQAIRVCVCGNYAYVVDAFRGLAAIDISNARFPSLQSRYDDPDFYAEGIYADQTWVYVTFRGLSIFNGWNLQAPGIVGSYDMPGSGRVMFAANGYIYFAEAGQLLILQFEP
jgi:hypothetical protein